jgi:hypothetical protein
MGKGRETGEEAEKDRWGEEEEEEDEEEEEQEDEEKKVVRKEDRSLDGEAWGKTENTRSLTNKNCAKRSRNRGDRGRNGGSGRFRAKKVAAGTFYAKPPGSLLGRLRQWLQDACGPGPGGTGGGGGHEAGCRSFSRQNLAFEHHDRLAGWKDGAIEVGDGGGGAKGTAAEFGAMKVDKGRGVDGVGMSTQETSHGKPGWVGEGGGEGHWQEAGAVEALRPFATNLRLWSLQDPASQHGRRLYTVCPIQHARLEPEGGAERLSVPGSRTSNCHSRNAGGSAGGGKEESNLPSASEGRRDGSRAGGRKGFFIEQYLRMDPSRRHVYEIIREGYPCRLYFDVEFSRPDNPDLDGEEMMRELQKVVREVLAEVGVKGGRDAGGTQGEGAGRSIGTKRAPVSFLELDSSTEVKFSRHVIVHLKGGRLFRSNAHVGSFVRRVVAKFGPAPTDPCAEESGGKKAHSLLWVKKREEEEAFEEESREGGREEEGCGPGGELAGRQGGPGGTFHWQQPPLTPLPSHDMPEENTLRHTRPGKQPLEPRPPSLPPFLPPSLPTHRPPTYVLAIDTSVYTKNRAFRLLYSRKFGKTATFQVTPASFQSFLPHSSCPLCPPPSSPPNSPEEWLLASLVVPYLPCGHLPPSNFIIFPETSTPPSYYKLGGGTTRPSDGGDAGKGRSAPSHLAFEAEAGRSSPFPELDAYVQTHHMAHGGVQGVIRGWQYAYSSRSGALAPTQARLGEGALPPTFLPSSMLTFQVGGNRWCHRIGRAHKSNHTMVVVDLRRGCLYQRCHDPDCRTYKGPLQWLPKELVPAPDVLDSVEFEAALTDACAKAPDMWGGRM